MESTRPLSVDVLCALREEWCGRLHIEWVSLTPLDVFDNPVVAQNIAAQVREAGGILGCFVYRNPDLHARLERVFDLAAEYRLDLDFHVDEGLDPDADGLRQIAQIALQRRSAGLALGRITCGHACSLSVQPRAEAESTLAMVAEADITLVTLPTTNLYLQGAWDETPVPRGMTRVHEARRAGVRLCLATDNVADPFYPYGSYDLLESWVLGVQVAHLAPAEDWWPSVTLSPAQAMGLVWDGRLAPGCPADFVLLQARDGLDVMNPAGRQRRVCRQGVWI
jgi:cytosine deaminase